MATTDRQRHRLATIARHLAPAGHDAVTTRAALASSHCASSTSGARRLSSYERVHGSVARDLPTWVPVPQPAGQEFQDILYEKSASDAIAKVKIALSLACESTLVTCI